MLALEPGTQSGNRVASVDSLEAEKLELERRDCSEEQVKFWTPHNEKFYSHCQGSTCGQTCKSVIIMGGCSEMAIS